MEDEMPADSDLALAELRGSLEAFARFNNKTNHGYTFTLDVLPLTGSIEQSIKCSFGDDVTKVSVFPIDDWQTHVRDAFRRWLFQFQNSTTGRLVDTGRNFYLSSDIGREAVLDWIMATLDRVIKPLEVGKVKIE